MAQLLLNKKTLRSRKNLKQNQKNSKKLYGKDRVSGIKSYLGKFVRLKEVDNHKEKVIGRTIEIKEIKSLLALLRDNQLTGMSGNGHPTVKKIETFLSSKENRKVLIVNAVECEPGLLHDEWLLQNHLKEIIEGVNKIKEILDIKDAVIASKCAIQAPYNASNIQFTKVSAKYPIGEEHLLIRQVLQHDLEKESIPAQYGILVLNVQTVYQIYKLFHGTYDGGRYVTLADIDQGDAVVAYVYKEDCVQEALENYFGYKAREKAFAGCGIMEANSITKDMEFQDKITFAAVGTQAILSNENQCKGCGGCSRRCPADINVKLIVQRREKDWNADISGLGAERCLNCGTCTYVCRAQKDVASYVRGAEAQTA